MMKVADFMHEMRETSKVLGRNVGAYVTFSGDKAYTDGTRINLPSMGLDKTLTRNQVMVMRGYVDHEAGHLRHSSMERLMDFYKRCLNNDKEGLKTLHNCVEDVWMEGEVIKDYPGAEKNLKATNELVKSREARGRVECEEFIKTGDPAVFSELDAKSLRKMKANPELCEGYREKLKEDLNAFNSDNIGASIKAFNPSFYSEGGDAAANDLLDTMPDKVKAFSEVWAQQARDCKNTEECITLAKSIWKLLEEDPELESNPEDFDPTSGEGDEEGEPGDVGDEEAKEGQGPGQPGGTKPGEEEGEGEGSGKSLKEILGDDYMPSLEQAMTTESGDGAGGIGGMDGPLVGGYAIFSTEDDIEYRKGGNQSKGSKDLWNIVNDTDSSKYTEIVSRLTGNVSVMKTKLRQALRAKDRRDWNCGREFGQMDRKRLTAGVLGATNIYKTRADREEENTAVTFLVDLSGSMGGRKADVARDCTVALTECLEGTNITFKIVGFCNRDSARRRHGSGGGSYHRYERLDTVVFKDFDQPSRTARGAVAGLKAAVGGNNTDYDFIQQELSYLRKRTEERKVLFVLSDGYPAHQSDASGSEIVRHCKEAIKAGKKDGVECIGIGICSDAVTKIYDQNVVVNDVNELSSSVFMTLTKLLVGTA